MYYITQSIVLELKIRLLLEQNTKEIKTGHYFNLSLTYTKPLFRGLTLKSYTFIETVPSIQQNYNNKFIQHYYFYTWCYRLKYDNKQRELRKYPYE